MNQLQKEQKNILKQELINNSLFLTDIQIEQFLMYYELLIEKNKVINLTAITDYKQVVYKHFIDSLSLIRAIDLKYDYDIIDLGTGAGFPGIPLKIAFPHLNILLLDSLNKRIKFLNEVIEKLNLNYITAIHGRAEELAKKTQYREAFDLCVSRAVANLATLSEYCIPFIKVGGTFISYKSGEIQEELQLAKKAVSILGGEIRQIDRFQLKNTDMERSLIIINKNKQTPNTYPRLGGKPSKEPLK